LYRIIGGLAVEDEVYPLGEAVRNQLVDDITFEGILVDADGSETLTFKITGTGGDRLIYDESFESEVNYQGGSYELSAAALLNSTLLAEPHFSGQNPPWYADLVITVTAQELDGSVAYSEPWPVSFEVEPRVDQDGISSTTPSYSVTEKENEVGDVGIKLANLYTGSDATVDEDGSEYVVDYNIDLNSMIEDAKIGQRLQDLNPNATVNVNLLMGYLMGEGDYIYNEANGTLTVYVDGRDGGLGSLYFAGTLFFDSSQNFKLGFRARVQDKAELSTGTMIVETEQSGFYEISISGTADVPIVYADDISGTRPIRVQFNGTIADTDPALGRDQSEGIYYFVQLLAGTEYFESSALYSFVDAQGELVGRDAGCKSTSIVPGTISKATFTKLMCDLLLFQPARGTSRTTTYSRIFS
jgi:hypothetical protein